MVNSSRKHKKKKKRLNRKAFSSSFNHRPQLGGLGGLFLNPLVRQAVSSLVNRHKPQLGGLVFSPLVRGVRKKKQKRKKRRNK